MVFYKGDIIWPIRRTSDPKKLRHPAVVWEDQTSGEEDFMGIMLTSSTPQRGYDNIHMKLNHFKIGMEVSYKRSYFVNQVFIKFASWGPFEKVGELTDGGKRYIEMYISTGDAVSFDEYLFNSN